MTRYRVKVFCCNWSHANAPHAGVYVLDSVTGYVVDGTDWFYGTWRQAMDRAAVLSAHWSKFQGPVA